MILADAEFSSMKDLIMQEHGIVLNPSAANEHVPEVERAIRVIKERNRASVSGLPYVQYPKVLKRALVANAVTWINMFPHADGVSNIISPRTIVTGLVPDYAVHCRVPVGSYCEVHDDPRITNTELARTTPAIALNPTGNTQGSVLFLSLKTGKTLTRKMWTELPITEEIIEAVHNLAEEEGNTDGNDFVFEWAPNQPVVPLMIEQNEDNIMVVNNIENTIDAVYDEAPAYEAQQDLDPLPANDAEVEADQNIDLIPNVEAEELSDAPEEESHSEYVNSDDEGSLVDQESSDELSVPPHNNKYNLRGKNIDYSYRYDHSNVQFLQTVYIDDSANVVNHAFSKGFQCAQYGVKAGVKMYGEAAVQAVMNECKQLDSKDALHPIMRSSITHEQYPRVLRAITMIKRKRCGRMKGRTVADGSKQREYTDKSEATASTIAIGSLFISICIDAKENRCVATCDIEGAYLNALMKKFIIMVYDGVMVDYLVAVNPEKYAPFVHHNSHGKKQLFVRLNKALYGCIESAQLWYESLCNTLVKKLGFTLNPYDPCVVNKPIDGHQCTICWYVDDLKISHANKTVVMNVIKTIEAVYGKMTVNIDKEHTYVGMNILYPGNGEAIVSMKDHVREAIDDFPESCDSGATSPAPTHLFQVSTELPPISETNRKLFHKIVAKLLFIANRARPDIMVAVSFLTSRVTSATDEDWKKLKRLLCYLYSTIELPLTISIDNVSITKTWVDASYACHPDMRSHTGGAISMGKGVLFTKTAKQKLNTNSSTEAEVVGASDFLLQTIWTKNFIEAQGYETITSEYYQDNLSAMQMETNGRASAGQKSRHINIRYFFIKDRVDSGDIVLLHCPTYDMVADFFTKPLQGKLFKRFRDVIMGVKSYITLKQSGI